MNVQGAINVSVKCKSGETPEPPQFHNAHWQLPECKVSDSLSLFFLVCCLLLASTIWKLEGKRILESGLRSVSESEKTPMKAEWNAALHYLRPKKITTGK